MSVLSDERAAFLAWAKDKLLVGRSGKVSPSGEIAWQAWQAAIAADRAAIGDRDCGCAHYWNCPSLKPVGEKPVLRPVMSGQKPVADRAARAEPVAWIIQWDNDPDDVVTSMHNDDLQQALGAGWPIQYLYTAPPAAPVVPPEWRHLMTSVSRMRQHFTNDDGDCCCSQCCMAREAIELLAAAPAPSQEPTT